MTADFVPPPLPGLAPDWVAACRQAAQVPPLAPRVPLSWRGVVFGSIDPGVLAHPAWRELLAADPALAGLLQTHAPGWALSGDVLTASLERLALGWRAAGLAHAWRDEQLPVTDGEGRALGTVERGVCRLLGISTEAVHLHVWAPDGRCWLQQRAFTKDSDPGQWDTLVGGMVPAGESLLLALARETAEEAGLHLDQLQHLHYGGFVPIARPAGGGRAHGYVNERLHWYTAVLPEGVAPANQDGEVAAFACLDGAEVARRLQAGAFTLEAGLILLAASGA